MCVFAYVIALIVFQIGKLFAGSTNVFGLVAALALLGLMFWQLFKPYKESTKLTKKVKV